MTEALKTKVSVALCTLVSTGSVSTPLSALNLLAKLVSSAHRPPPLRLHDLPRFESILESLSVDWDHGTITLLRDSAGLTLMDINLVRNTQPTAGPSLRKRKRPVDEEAESDTEADNEEYKETEHKNPIPTVSSLSNLSKDMKEIYAMLQKPTAKGRLLAEQVR